MADSFLTCIHRDEFVAYMELLLASLVTQSFLGVRVIPFFWFGIHDQRFPSLGPGCIGSCGVLWDGLHLLFWGFKDRFCLVLMPIFLNIWLYILWHFRCTYNTIYLLLLALLSFPFPALRLLPSVSLTPRLSLSLFCTTTAFFDLRTAEASEESRQQSLD